MIPGLASVNGSGVPVSVAAPGHTFGDRTISPIAETTPTTTPVTAPVVLNRRQVSASSSAGKFALAAIANARPTMNETFRPSPPITAIAIAIRPIDAAAMRATTTSSFSESRPLRTMLDQMSCATAPDADSTSPATTARIVAKATPAITARNRSPPNVPSPPPSSAARVGAARLPPVPAAATPPSPSTARAPKPMNVVSR